MSAPTAEGLSPLAASPEGGDSVLQTAVRAGQQPGEDWDTSTLLQVVLDRAHGVGCRAAAAPEDDNGDRLLVITDAPAHLFAATSVRGLHETQWKQAPEGSRRDGSTPATLRRERLNVIADALFVEAFQLQTLPALLAQPYHSSSRHLVNLGLGLWWQARLAEGHTMESADTMLGLLAHSTVMKHLSYRRTDWRERARNRPNRLTSHVRCGAKRTPTGDLCR